MRRVMFRAFLICCSTSLLTACGGDSTPTTPTIPTPTPPVTEVFTGQINRNGAATHPFRAGDSGSVTVTLNTVLPEGITAIGLSLGTWNGAACQTVIANDNAVAGASIIGTASTAGNLCVRVYDVGRIPDLASYEVSVLHP